MIRKEDALRVYATMMNTLDAGPFALLLADDFHYASQWVFAEIESKQEYLDYITKKLQAVKTSDLNVWAEMAEIEESFAVLSNGWGTPCVVLGHGTEKVDAKALVFVEVEGDAIRRLDLCMPEMYRWKLSGAHSA